MAKKKATKKKVKVIVRGRDAKDGKFIKVADAKRRKATAIVDRMPVRRKRKVKRK